jgi:NitT/TauT family transport system permease protein
MAAEQAVSSASARAGESRRSARRFASGLGLLAAQVLLGLALLAFWELASGTLIDSFFVSKPSLVLRELSGQIASGGLWNDLFVTIVQETLVGYVLGALLGVVLGFVLAQAPTAARILNPYLMAINGIPRIALAPLFLVWFGIGLASKIWLGGMMAFFLTFFNTFAGVGGVDQGLKNVARVMGASPLQVLLKVVLPASTPWIVAGLRLGFPYALVAAVVGEMVMSTAGIGHRIIAATQVFNVTGTMAGVLVLMVVVMLVNWLLDRAEAHLLRWRPTGPDTATTQA